MSAVDRLLDALRAIIRAEFPVLTFLGLYEYTVQSSSGSTASAVPSDPSIGLPQLAALPLSPSILGEQVTGAAVGAVALVTFVNGDPTRPVCTSLSLPSNASTVDATGTLALGPSASAVSLAGGTAPVGRQGDAVTVYLGTTPIPISGTVAGVGALSGLITFAGPATGIVVGGRPQVTA